MRPSTTAHTRLHGELQRLRSLYITAREALAQMAVATRRQIRERQIDPALEFNVDSDGLVVTPNASVFLRNTENQYPRYLRETLFVRAISALEVFFIHAIREAFVGNRTLFSSQGRVEFAVAELVAATTVTDLWSKLIQRETRALNAKGFAEVVKYCASRFGINFGGSPVALDVIREMHDRRHLLVHRLGVADEEYRHRYHTTDRIVTVSEEYLLGSLAKLDSFAQFVHTGLTSTIRASASTVPAVDKSTEKRERKEVVVDVHEAGRAAVNKSYVFSVGEHMVQLADILESCHVVGTQHTMILSGRRQAVRTYVKCLKKFAATGGLVLQSTAFIPESARDVIPPSLLNAIAAVVPPLPWPKGLHFEIAAKFSLKTKAARVALNILRKRLEPNRPSASPASQEPA